MAHTQVSFAIRHLGISLIRGNMRLNSAELELNEEEPEKSSLVARLDASTLDTRDPSRDGHLKSADFLNVETFPFIEFRSTRVSRKGEDQFLLAGDLTIRDQTRPVEMQGEYRGPVADPISGKRKVGFLVSGEILQKDWGIDWNVPMSGGFMLADRLTLTIDAQAIED
jgi:polyisoprenoid-binding protein YceI